MSLLLKAIWRFNVTSVKIAMAFFRNRTTTTKILKFVWKHRRCRVAKETEKEQN